MTESYPVRERYWSHRFCRLLTKLAIANEIGSEACWMLTVIAHQEDAKRYRGAVTYFNEQLMPLCAIMTQSKLNRVRNRAIQAGWLHYEPGGKGKAGRYWCVIPKEFEDIPDGPMDEGTPSDLRCQNAIANTENEQAFPIQNRSANGAQTGENGFTPSPVEAQTERKRSANDDHSTLSLYPNPKEEISASAEICPVAVETPAPSRPPDEPTEFTFECVGRGGKSWTLPKSKLDEYLEAYPDLDVRAEIRKSRQWIRDNRANRKTAAGMPAFLTRWLNKSQNSGGRNRGTQQSTEQRQLAELDKAIKRTEQEIRDAEGSGPALLGLP